jgi:hypothetical protein
MDLVVPALEHDHDRVSGLNPHEIDTDYFIPFFTDSNHNAVINFLLAIVREATSNHSSVRYHKRSVVEESLASHCHVVEHDSLPERKLGVCLSPALRDRVFCANNGENY